MAVKKSQDKNLQDNKSDKKSDSKKASVSKSKPSKSTKSNATLLEPIVHNRATFKTQEIWEDQWEAFFQKVRDSDYKIFPTKANFAKEIGCSYSTIMKAFTMYPESFVSVNNMLADILVEGVALKYWQSGMIIFSMKNWCGWSDKREVFNTNETKELVSTEDFKQSLLDYMQREGIKVLPSN